MTDVITGLGPEWESLVATTLESASDLTVTRRCADVAELLSVAEAGLGKCVVLSADLRGLDLTIVRRLSRSGVLILGLYPGGDEGAERRLHQLGVSVVLPVDADAATFSAAVRARTETGATGPSAPPALPGAGADADGPVVVPDHVPDDCLDVDRASNRDAEPDLDAATNAAPFAAGRGDEPLSPSGALPSEREVPGGWQPRDSAPESNGPARSTIIAVWGPTGAPGRTTVAVNVAVELASRGQDVLLVDADTYGGCVAQALGLLDEAPGIAAVCRAAEQGTLDLPVLARLAPVVTSGLRVLTGLPKAERWPELRSAALERVLDLARALTPIVVVDCGFCIEDDATRPP
jgi:hypothetical protein